MNDPLQIACPACGSPFGTRCVTKAGKPKATCAERTRAAVFADLKREREAAAAPKPAAQVAAARPDDFDDATPPPKGRPIGEPVPGYVTLPPGEDVPAVFAQWDKAGRIPAGAVLCRWPECAVAATGAGVPRPANLDRHRIAVTIRALPAGMAKWLVMVPMDEQRKAGA